MICCPPYGGTFKFWLYVTHYTFKQADWLIQLSSGDQFEMKKQKQNRFIQKKALKGQRKDKARTQTMAGQYLCISSVSLMIYPGFSFESYV